MKQFKTSNRKTIFSELHDYCYLSKEHDYIEVTEWTNGDGFDIHVSGHIDQKISLTHGEFKLLKKLVKELNKVDSSSLYTTSYPNTNVEYFIKKEKKHEEDKAFL